MSKRARNQGILIIAALLVAVVVALFVGAALKLSNMSLKATDTTAKRAHLAAESGLRYVQSCQAADFGWTADRGLVVDTPDLVVREDNGNIVGILRTDGGEYAQFRIRFNFQDDSGADADGRTDPSTLFVDSQYVSVQNLLGGSPRSVPRADGPGWSVTPTSPRPYDVPAGSTCVLVEGRAGAGLSGLSASNLNPTPNGKVTTRVIEGYLEAPVPPGGDSAAQSAGDMEFDVEGAEAVTLSAKNDGPSKLRTRSNIVVQDGGLPNLVSTAGEAHTVDSSLTANPDSNIQTFVEDTSRDFLRLGWSDVKQATSSDSQLAAGTYVVWDDGSLHYYDMDYASYATHIQLNPTDAGSVAVLPAGMTLDNSTAGSPRIEISQNVLVNDSGNTDELNIIPRKGAQENPPDSADSNSELASGAELELGTATHALTGSMTDGTRYEETANYVSPGNTDIQVTGVAQPFSVQLHGDHWHIRDDSQTVHTSLTPSEVIGLLTQPGLSTTDQNAVTTILQAIGGGRSAAMEEFDLGSEQPDLRPDNVVIDFQPPEGESAILSSKGSVRLGANVRGEGGSITSEADVRIIGNGADLSASVENGLAIYAQGNVTMSSLKEIPLRSNNWEYKDVKFEGVVYSWANIRAKLSNDDPSVARHGNFLLQGAMVAYGGDPTGAVGSNGEGQITVNANSVELKYDPVYIMQLTTPQPSGPLVQTLHTIY